MGIADIVRNPLVLGSAALLAAGACFANPSFNRNQRHELTNSSVISQLADTVSSYFSLSAAEAAEFKGEIDRTTYWTKDKLRQLINSDKRALIYWKFEGLGDNETGDRLFKDLLRDYGDVFSKVIVIEGNRLGVSSANSLKRTLDEFNPEEERNTLRWPNYSMVGFGKEVRIRGPPTPSDYDRKFENVYKPEITKYLRELLRWNLGK